MTPTPVHIEPTWQAGNKNAGRIVVLYPEAALTSVMVLSDRLSGEGFEVVAVTLTSSAVEEIDASEPDVVMVAFSPGAFDLGRLCRDLASWLPCRVVVMTIDPDGIGSEIDEDVVIGALDDGADDLVSELMSTPVLSARVRVAMRGRPVRHRSTAPLVLGDLLIDVGEHIVRIAGTIVSIRPLQFHLLVVLATRAGSAVTRDELLAEVWGVNPGTVDPRRVRIAISGLRRLLGPGVGTPQIESVWRQGYRLNVPAAD